MKASHREQIAPPEAGSGLVEQGLLAKKGDFVGMDSEADREDDRDYEPDDDGDKIGTEQEAQNQQSGNSQNPAENQQLVLFQTPPKATHAR